MKELYIYKLSQTVSNGYDYESRRSCIVVAESMEQARRIRPATWKEAAQNDHEVTVEYLGLLDANYPAGTILCYFEVV